MRSAGLTKNRTNRVATRTDTRPPPFHVIRPLSLQCGERRHPRVRSSQFTRTEADVSSHSPCLIVKFSRTTDGGRARSPPSIYKLRSGCQVQDDLLDVRGSVGAATGVRIAGGGPAGEVPGGVFVVVSASPQGDEGLILDEDLLDTLDGLHLHALVGGRGVLVQELVGFGVVPGDKVGLALTDQGTVQVVVVQVVRRRATNHAAEHHLIIKLAIRAQGVVVVLRDGDIVDLNAHGLRFRLDQLRRRVPVRIGVNASQREAQVFAVLLEVAIRTQRPARAGKVFLRWGNIRACWQIGELRGQPALRGWQYQTRYASGRLQASRSLLCDLRAVNGCAEGQSDGQTGLTTNDGVFLVDADRIEVDGVHEQVVVLRVLLHKVLIERRREVAGPVNGTLRQR